MIDDQRQILSEVGKLARQVRHLEQLLAQLSNLIAGQHGIMPSPPEQDLSLDPNAYPSDPISLKDAAKVLGVHRSFIYRLMKQSGLRSWKLPGGHKRVSKADILALPELCDSTSPPSPPDTRRWPRGSRVRKEMSRFTQETLERFRIQVGEEVDHGS